MKGNQQDALLLKDILTVVPITPIRLLYIFEVWCLYKGKSASIIYKKAQNIGVISIISSPLSQDRHRIITRDADKQGRSDEVKIISSKKTFCF